MKEEERLLLGFLIDKEEKKEFFGIYNSEKIALKDLHNYLKNEDTEKKDYVIIETKFNNRLY